MIVVGMISAYKEARLVRGAISSLLDVDLDALYVWEGPAGDPLGDDVPESDYPFLPDHRTMMDNDEPGAFVVKHHGRWRTDARKRNDMLQRVKRDFPGPDVWAVVLDGDEVLVNAEYLRDMIQHASWASDPDEPTARLPLRLIERDGGIQLITARVYRVDLIREYNVSSSLVTNIHGVQEGWGNRPELHPMMVEAWAAAMERGQLACLPPFPCEPCIVHRSHLRHPLRSRLRMSEQELSELRRAQAEAEGV